MRISAKMVEATFQLFCLAMNKRVAQSWEDKGAWGLDNAPEYGGWYIYELMNHGGQCMPFGCERCSGKELVEKMQFAMRALEVRPTIKFYHVEYEVRRIGAIGEFVLFSDNLYANNEEQAKEKFRQLHSDVFEFRNPISCKELD